MSSRGEQDQSGSTRMEGQTTDHTEAPRQTTCDDMRRMNQLLQGRFLPPDYQQILYNQFKYYQQGTSTVTAYTESSIGYHPIVIYP